MTSDQARRKRARSRYNYAIKTNCFADKAKRHMIVDAMCMMGEWFTLTKSQIQSRSNHGNPRKATIVAHTTSHNPVKAYVDTDGVITAEHDCTAEEHRYALLPSGQVENGTQAYNVYSYGFAGDHNDVVCTSDHNTTLLWVKLPD